MSYMWSGNSLWTRVSCRSVHTSWSIFSLGALCSLKPGFTSFSRWSEASLLSSWSSHTCCEDGLSNFEILHRTVKLLRFHAYADINIQNHLFYITKKCSPGGPCGPMAPSDPLKPFSPGAPISPLIPSSPGSPIGPGGPGNPGRPGNPSLPVGPGNPGGP